MNAKTKEAIERHGKQLLAIFPNATERDPVALCKKLRRIETSLERPLVGYCNGTTSETEVDKACDRAKKRVADLLGLTVPQLGEMGFFVNRDPRGVALKIDDGTMRKNNWQLHRDWGGYGLLAPDLTEE